MVQTSHGGFVVASWIKHFSAILHLIFSSPLLYFLEQKCAVPAVLITIPWVDVQNRFSITGGTFSIDWK